MLNSNLFNKIIYLIMILICTVSTAFASFPYDIDVDQDLDGKDLIGFIIKYQVGGYSLVDLSGFAADFGKSNFSTVGTTYYIDYENGDDTQSGKTPITAWQHAPGDPLATDLPARIGLEPGDTVLFKGDVIYRGQIKIPADGSASHQITYKGDGWPGLGNSCAVIDGGQLLTGWQPCDNAADCGGNPNFEHIYYTQISQQPSVLTVNLHEQKSATGQNEFRWLAQDPNPSDPYFMDNRFEFMIISQAQLTRTSITDTSYFTQTDPDYWQGSSLLIWINPNIVGIREISGFDPETHTVQFDDLGPYAIYPDGRDQAYAIYNSMHALDYPGEYAVGPAIDDTRKVFLWPMDTADLDHGITRSVRSYGIDLSNHQYITIEGFEIRNHAGENVRQGVALGTISAAQERNQGIIIRNNLITHNAYSGTGNSRSGYGGIYLQNVADTIVENNQIVRNPRHRGIFVSGGAQNTFIRNNTIIRPGSTALSLYTAFDCRIIGNTIKESNGSHANGITLYMGCRNILVANNTVLDSGSPLTFEDSGNLYFYNNIFDGHNSTNNVNEWDDTSHGPWERGEIAFFHNVMVRNDRNAALNIGQVPTLNTYIVKNNIIDGGAAGSFIDRSHNLYTGLCWNQKPAYGWYPGPGEFVQENLSMIFADPENLDFHLIPGSPAIDSGTDITAQLPVTLFPEFDFSLDKDGKPRQHWDLGAYGL